MVSDVPLRDLHRHEVVGAKSVFSKGRVIRPLVVLRSRQHAGVEGDDGCVAAFIGNDLHVAGGSFQADGMPGIYSQMATHEVYAVDN
jgi:hypothetical protein